MTWEQNAPYGYDSWSHTKDSSGRETRTHTEVVPKSKPNRWHWLIGPVSVKIASPTPGSPGKPATGTEEIVVQLTADQQVGLSIKGEDAYDNPVDISGDVVWTSSDESIITVEGNHDRAIATAVGPIGTAAVTVSNDVNQDGSGDFQGSIAIDVVAGKVAEILINEGRVSDKGDHVDNTLPDTGNGDHVDNTLPGPGSDGGEHPDNTLPDNPAPVDPNDPHPDNSLPGDQPYVDNSLPTDQPYVEPRSRRGGKR